MTCRHCSKEIDADSMFCRYCGTAVQEPIRPRRLTRRPAEGKLGGVCAGIARYLDTDPTIVRLAWVILSVVPGFVIGGLIAYAAAWVLLPIDGSEAPAFTLRRLQRSTTDRKIAGVCGGLAELLRGRFHTRADCGRRFVHLSRGHHLRGARVPDRLVCYAVSTSGDGPSPITIHPLNRTLEICGARWD